MNCPTCNTENPAADLFCSGCGTELGTPAGAHTDLGSPIEGEVIPPQPVAATSSSRPLLHGLGQHEYARFNLRFGAVAIDFVVVSIIIYTLDLALVPLGLARLSFIIWPAYFILLTSRYGSTLGKRALGLRVVDAAGNIPNLRQLVYREIYRFTVLYVAGEMAGMGILILTWISFAIFLVGHLAVIYDPLRRAWHDRLGKTYVVRVPRRPNYIQPAQSSNT